MHFFCFFLKTDWQEMEIISKSKGGDQIALQWIS